MAIQEFNPRNNEDPKSGSARHLPIGTFFGLFSDLEEIKRQGWVIRGIKDPESVAHHALDMAFEGLPEAKRRGLNVGRVMGMIFVHDLPELVSGDPTPYDNIPEEEMPRALQRWIPPAPDALERKKIQEHAALEEIVKNLSSRSLRTEIRSFWNEYEEEKTPEAKFVHEMDVLQRLSQAMRYRHLEGAQFPIGAFIQEALHSKYPEVRKAAKKYKKALETQSSS